MENFFFFDYGIYFLKRHDIQDEISMKVVITKHEKFFDSKDIPVPKVSFFNSHDCTYFAEWASENFYTYYDQTGIIHYLKIREEFGDSIF